MSAPRFVLAALICLLAGRSTLAASDQVMVVVASVGSGLDRVSFTFPRKVPHDEVLGYIHQLEAAGGWRAQAISITDETASGVPGTGNVMTAAEFSVAGAFVPASGSFNLWPFLSVFRRCKRIGFVYIVPRWFEYRGPPSFENSQVKVTVSSSQGSYTLEAEVKDPSLKSFSLPVRPAATQEQSSRARRGPGRGVLLAFVLLLALATGLVVFLLAYWLWNAGSAGRPHSVELNGEGVEHAESPGAKRDAESTKEQKGSSSTNEPE